MGRHGKGKGLLVVGLCLSRSLEARSALCVSFQGWHSDLDHQSQAG